MRSSSPHPLPIQVTANYPSSRHTPIAWTHRLLWVYLPNGLYALDQLLTSGRVTLSCLRFGNYIMYDKHPTILVCLSLFTSPPHLI